MLGLGTKHVVEAGTVHCTLRDKDVTVGQCLSCVALRAISHEPTADGHQAQIVRCEPFPQVLAT